MTTTALTSELEAINTLLGAIGESSINSLEVSGLADVASARATLNEISREVLSHGWQFNTEEDYPLNRDASNKITLPAHCIRAVFTKTHGDMKLITRGLKLYDAVDHTYTFTKDLTGTLVLLLPWDELPQVARHYIMIRASRIYQARNLGSDTQFQFSEQEEGSARSIMEEHEGDTGGYNMFSGSASVITTLAR